MKIFDTSLPDSRDKDFCILQNNSRFQKERTLLERMWTKFEPYADRDFLLKIREDLHPRFWELYFGYALLQQGFRLKPKSNPLGPDYVVENSPDVIIEATTSSGGTGPDSIKKQKELKSGEVEWFSVPDNKIILRYRSSIEDKYKKYEKYVSDGIFAEAQPFIIAVNGRNVPYSILDDEPLNIVKALFPIGDPYVTLDKDTGNIVGQGFHIQPSIKKTSGQPISTRIFLDPSYFNISAVIFSNSNMFNLPNDIGADLILVHNPQAKIPLNRGWLPTGKEYWVENNQLKNKIHKK